MRGVRRTGTGLAWEVTGSGPALLLIHEGIADRTMWDLQWGEWSDRFTLIRYDLRGYGDSPDADAPYTLAGDALEVLDAAGCERAAVIGASIGGRAALDLALLAPDRIGAVVEVVATPSGWRAQPSLLAAFERVDAAFEADGLEAANEVELQMWVDGPGREPGAAAPAVRNAVARMNAAALAREQARERAGNEVEPGEPDPPALDRLGELTAALLVITGEHDQPSVTAGARVLAERTGAELVEIAATAHVPTMERPAEFEAAVLPFLKRV